MDVLPPRHLAAEATPLPLRFRRPAGWPEPSADWLAANQGWDPPAGWTPLPGVAPAPDGWLWWTHEETGWSALTSQEAGRLRGGVAGSVIVLVAGAMLTAFDAVQHLGLSFLFWGVLIFGSVTLVRSLSALGRAPGTFSSFVRGRAAEIHRDLDAAAYAEHRATAGTDALPFDRFLARRASEAWSFTGTWPADQRHLGAPERFRLPTAPSESCHRQGLTLVLALIAGVGLVVLSLHAFGDSQAGSGEGSRALDLDTGTGGSTSSAAVTSSLRGPAPATRVRSGARLDALVLVPGTPSAAACVGSAKCFVIRIGSSSSCSKATLVVDFFSSPGEIVAERHETLTVNLTGSAFTDAVVAEPTPADVHAGVADAFCSTS